VRPVRAAEPDNETPFVLVERARNALRLAAVDARGLAAGLYPGMTLADARARAPALDAAPADPAADARLLERLAGLCERFSPWVALDPPDALLLDVTGCAHLLGGESELIGAARAAMNAEGLSTRVALAGGGETALALARFASSNRAGARKPGAEEGVFRVPPGADERAARALPVAALRCAPETLTALARAGLSRLGDLADRPSATFAARFGPAFVSQLEAVIGRCDPPRAPVRPAPEHVVDARFAEPIAHMAAVETALADLAGALARDLEAAGAGGRVFEASFFRADGAVRRIRVETGRPQRDARALLGLFREKLDALADPLDPGFGYDALRLAALVAEPLAPAQAALAAAGFPGRAGRGEEAAALADRLTARFGRARVLRFQPRDTHDPDRASAWRPAADAAPAKAEAWAKAGEGEPPLRPLQIFHPPLPIDALAETPDGPPLRFRWRRRVHDVAASEGPERIAGDWRDPVRRGGARDYYRVEDREGRRFWIFREGLYGGETPPRWFVAGLFA
jgi:protein ImuB